jgi:hypothetical protein
MRLASSVISSVAVFCFFVFEHQTMEIVDISEKCWLVFYVMVISYTIQIYPTYSEILDYTLHELENPINQPA